MSATPALQTRQLTKRFGAREALSGLDLSVAPGELVALIGENGAGKTTALSMISGQLVPDSGAALVDGHDVFGAPLLARRALSYVAQTALLPPHLTINEMSEFACAVKGVGLDERERTRLLGTAGLEDDADRLIGELSHGMQRKAAWVVALVAKPTLLLLDEGLAGLDATSSAALTAEVARRLAGGLAVLWTEHDLDAFGAHLTRVEVLRRGRHARTIEGDALERRRAEGTLDALLSELPEEAGLTAG